MIKKNSFISLEQLRYVDFANIGLILLTGILGALICFFYFFAKNDTIIQTNQIVMPSEVVPELKFSKKQLAYYDKILSRKNVFAAQPGLRKKGKGSFSKSIDAMLEKLQLAGIVSGPQGPQAIINDLSTNRSVYCRNGEMVGGFKVKRVEIDKVILDSDGEEVELRL